MKKLSHTEEELKELEIFATEQLEFCERHPVPQPQPSDDIEAFMFWIAFDTHPRAHVSPKQSSIRLGIDVVAPTTGLYDVRSNL